MNENFKYLNVGLPEEILRLKLSGELKEAIVRIDVLLKRELPYELKACLLAEREIISRLPENYPRTKENAIALVKESIPDFTEAEFEQWEREGRLDWFCIHGEHRYCQSVFSSLKKTDKEIAKRAGAIFTSPDDQRDEVIKEMKAKGKAIANIKVKASIRIKDECFVPGKTVRAYLPIPNDCPQQEEIEILGFSDGKRNIAEVTEAQRTICFEKTLSENQDFWVEYSYRRIAQYHDMDRLYLNGEVRKASSYPASSVYAHPENFLGEEEPHIVFTPYLKALATDLTKNVSDSLEKARKIYDYITQNVTYRFVPDYFVMESIADNCAKTQKGDCGVQALLFITLCRIAGIPASWQSGLYLEDGEGGCHDWAMFYSGKYGWLNADPSFGGSGVRAESEERRKHYFGNLDPFRMSANRSYYQDFQPSMQGFRVDPYDNQTGEIQVNGVGLKSSQTTHKIIVESMEAEKE